MTNLRKFAPLALLLLIAGCNKAESETATNSSDPKPTTSSDSPKSDETALVLPDDLKGEAYEYYGLGRKEPMKIKFKQGSADSQDGSQTIKLTKVEKDFAEYTVSHTGALERMGTIILKLEKGGIKVSQTVNLSPEEGSWELPNGLTPGKTWDTNTKPGSIMELKSTNKVEGTGEVTTPVATYKDALIISSTGTGKSNGQTFQLTSKMWFVKGVGAVRTEVTQVVDSKTEKTVMEESK